MEVWRCGFYNKRNQMYQKNVKIEWAEEFTRDTKVLASQRIAIALGDDLYPYTDVTTAAATYTARSLSPYYVKTKLGTTVDSHWKKMLEQIDDESYYPGLFEFVYLNNLNQRQIDFIMSMRCFYDIYFNPKKKENTVARAAASLQLLIRQKKFEYLQDMNKFCYWYWANIGCLIEETPKEFRTW